MKTFPKNIFLYFALLAAAIGYSQTTSVAFRVNMSYQITLGNFNPSTQTVDIAGSFNNWGSPTTILTDTDGDRIYTGTLQLTVGTNYQFKTRINAQWNGTEEFPGGRANRSYTAVANDVVSYWYNDQIPANALVVNVTPSALIAQPGQVITFNDASSGTPVQWSWSLPGATPATSTAQNPNVTYTTPGNYSVTLTITNAAGETATQTFTNLIRIDPMETHWWNDRVFYEVFVRSFKDSNGDGKGDIQGLISKLDYLNDGNPNTTSDLGITGIWLMPIMESPSYHGYDVTNYMAVEQDYGTNADFAALIAACHQRGIKVIIDLVMNHTSNQHPWFTQSAANTTNSYRNWFLWSNTNPGTPGPFSANAWYLQNGSYYYGAFASSMPDLNYNTPAVHTAFQDIASFWLNDMDADGFRLDAVRYLYESPGVVQDDPRTIAFWRDFRSYYKSVKPDAFAVGEAWDVTSVAKQYTNNNGLDYCFEFDLSDNIITSLTTGSATGLINKMNEVMGSYPFLQWGTFLTNHDENRLMSQLGNSTDKAKAAAALLLTLPGIPYIYYGEEIGITGVKPDENIRTPMQWTGTTGAGFTTGSPWRSVNADYTTKNVAAQQTTTGSLWNLYRDLISIRNNEVTLRQGTYLPVTASNAALIAFVRQYQGQNILVVVNMGGTAITDAQLTLANGNITPSTYAFTNLLNNTEVIEQQVTSDGGFAGLNPGNIPALGFKIFKLTDTLSTGTVKNTTPLLLYPNPATSGFKVTVTGSVEIFSLNGQLIRKKTAVTANENIDINTFAKGVYLVKITDTTGRTETVKLLKQ